MIISTAVASIADALNKVDHTIEAIVVSQSLLNHLPSCPFFLPARMIANAPEGISGRIFGHWVALDKRTHLPVVFRCVVDGIPMLIPVLMAMPVDLSGQ